LIIFAQPVDRREDKPQAIPPLFRQKPSRTGILKGSRRVERVREKELPALAASRLVARARMIVQKHFEGLPHA
jgi:hypothetical protein